jgi:hypothetical protein
MDVGAVHDVLASWDANVVHSLAETLDIPIIV